MDQISDAKRGKKLKCKKKAEDVATDKNELKSKKAEAEEHEEQLKGLQETVSHLLNTLVIIIF